MDIIRYEICRMQNKISPVFSAKLKSVHITVQIILDSNKAIIRINIQSARPLLLSRYLPREMVAGW